LRSAPPPGVLGAATGEIAIGTTATSRSITIIIITRTTILTATSIVREGIGNTIRNTVEMRRTVIEEPLTSSVAMRVSSRGVAAELAVVAAPVARVELAERAAQAGREASAALVELAVQVDQEALAELAVQVDREALAELGVQVAVVLEHAQAVAGLEHGPVVVALEPAQVGVVPELGPLAVPPKNKLVIAAHHRGLVRVPKRAEDLVAAAVETTREPAVTAVARAWAAAE